jgi:hypothetical protein
MRKFRRIDRHRVFSQFDFGPKPPIFRLLLPCYFYGTVGPCPHAAALISCRYRLMLVPPLRISEVDSEAGVFMRKMHLVYAAIGFAVARWIFKRQAVVDPVTQFRSQGLL